MFSSCKSKKNKIEVIRFKKLKYQLSSQIQISLSFNHNLYTLFQAYWLHNDLL